MDKEFIKDGLNNDEIITIVRNIRTKVENNNNESVIDELKKEFHFFVERYPVLFELSTRTNEPFNWEYFNYFLNMRNKIISNELTSDKASVIIGEEWFKKHVKIPS